MKRYYYIIYLLSISFTLGAQVNPIANEIIQFKNSSRSFVFVDELLQTNNKASITNEQLSALKSAKYFNYNKEIASEIILNPKSGLILSLPYQNERHSELTLELVLVEEALQNYEVVLGDGTLPENPGNGGVHYRGVVTGFEQNSLVALSIFEKELMAVISIQGNKAINIGKLTKQDLHIIYNEKDLENNSFECHTTADFQNKILDDLYENIGNKSVTQLENCVNLYFETDHEIYEHFNDDIDDVVNFVIGIFNQAAAIYFNESITMNLTEIFIWNIPDSYSNSISTGLIQFVAARPTFNGDVAQLLTFRNGTSDPNNLSNAGGKANGIGGLCVTGDSQLSPHCHTSLFPEFEIFPVFSRQVKVVTHEVGHNLGSRHTHACVWNGNATAIDNCAGATEGSCSLPPSPPANGGTIMSYCDRTVGIDFALGFGPQPGDFIRNMINNASCLTACGGTACPENLALTGTEGSAILYQAEISIGSDQVITSSADVKYTAGNAILLTDVFVAEYGSVFEATIEDCLIAINDSDDTYARSVPEPDESNLKISELYEDIVIRIYPNPFSGNTTIEYNLREDSPVEIFITDFTGKVIRQLLNDENMKGNHQIEFNGSDLPNGTYFCVIHANGKTKTHKLLVVN